MSDVPLQAAALECLLNESNHPDAEKAVQEYRHLRAVQRHLLTHITAVKLQTAASLAGIQDEIQAVSTPAAPALPGLASPEASA